ncbi:hypothetical protein XELAEV_18041353mg [Xenopus laevis]|uniref:Uncharacterized protein n=1 Tax=Xenopus laevis TaxID=8355 RepID=A0A974C2A2_XENLA|nr:hypothetical protein XELAEV_18041353mg [Xenopus laevis]
MMIRLHMNIHCTTKCRICTSTNRIFYVQLFMLLTYPLFYISMFYIYIVQVLFLKHHQQSDTTTPAVA